ncbi:MAG: WbqC family protein [Thermodesulfobacteriota bacterium]
MRVTINQPLFFQRLHMFNRIAECDIAVVLHSAQFVRNGDQPKLFLKSANRLQEMKVPTLHDGRQSIKDTRIDYGQQWQRKMIRTIEMNYGKTPFFSTYFDAIKKIICQTYASIGELNIATLRYGMAVLGIDVKLVLDDELDIDPYDNPSDWMLNICKALHATEYHCGKVAADKYLDYDRFRKVGIKVFPQDWTAREYEQPYKPFIGNLSVIDLLMNVGGGDAGKEMLR